MFYNISQLILKIGQYVILLLFSYNKIPEQKKSSLSFFYIFKQSINHIKSKI